MTNPSQALLLLPRRRLRLRLLVRLWLLLVLQPSLLLLPPPPPSPPPLQSCCWSLLLLRLPLLLQLLAEGHARAPQVRYVDHFGQLAATPQAERGALLEGPTMRLLSVTIKVRGGHNKSVSVVRMTCAPLARVCARRGAE